jgi:hypothetical protein
VAGLGIPVAFGINSGHVDRCNVTLALGVRVLLSVEEEAGTLRFLEPAVSIE